MSKIGGKPPCMVVHGRFCSSIGLLHFSIISTYPTNYQFYLLSMQYQLSDLCIYLPTIGKCITLAGCPLLGCFIYFSDTSYVVCSFVNIFVLSDIALLYLFNYIDTFWILITHQSTIRFSPFDLIHITMLIIM